MADRNKPSSPGRGFGRWFQGCFGRGRGGFVRPGRPENCVCTVCGFVAIKQPGSPCYLTPCPKCGARMARKFENGQ